MLAIFCIAALVGCTTVGLIAGPDQVLASLGLTLALLAILSSIAFTLRGHTERESLRSMGVVGLFFCLGIVMFLMVNGLAVKGIAADRKLEEGLRSLALLGAPVFVASLSVILGMKPEGEA
jgi:ABC-type transport system involved in cytochrome c biogenesis permease subunit